MAATRLDDAIGWLTGQRGAMEALLERLVLHNSFTRNRHGVEAVANLAAGQLRTLALDVELRASPHFGPHVLFAGPAAGAPVYLVGHTDTAHPPGAGEGFLREGDRAVGPGACDMKGGVVVMLFGLAAAKRAGLLERVALRGALVSDEEAGSPESRALLRTHAEGAVAGLCFEPGRPGDLLVTTREGGGSLEVEARGLAAHAGNEPEKGHSAIWSLARLIDRVQLLTDPGRGRFANVALISGGAAPNTIPAEARCEIDLRFESSKDGRALVEAVRAAAAEVALSGTGITVLEGAWREPLSRTSGASALAKAYGECQRQCGLGMGEAPRLGGASDACTLGAMGIPTVDGLGVRGRGAHTAREEVDLSSLVPKALALLRFLALRAGV
jgi:glutamate carboxypeptidase